MRLSFGSRRTVPQTIGAPQWRPVVVSLLVAASSLAATLSPAAAAYPGASNGLLAFGMKDASGNGQIYTAAPDGTGATPLTTGAFTHLCAAYSADASKIAYCSNESGAFEIWTMNADGTGQTQLTKLGGFATFPDYSPDGTTVAFGGTQAPDTHNEILTVDATTGASIVALTSCNGGKPGCSNDWPAWSPDGTRIAWVHTDDADADGNATSSQVWVMDADGSDAHALTTDPPLKGQLPDWSPDGTQIAYASGSDGSGGLWVMNADGSNPHQIAGCVATDPAPCATGEEIGPTWSPDGKLIAFLHIPVDATTDRPIMVMNADGSSVHRLMSDPSFQYVPAWQPVGVSQPSSTASAGSTAPAWVTGTIVFGPCNSSPSDTTDPGVTHNRDFLCDPAPITSSDPRLAGTYVQRWNEDIYAVAGPQMVISAGTYDLQNADGSWDCSWDASFINNMFPPPPGATVTISCVGAGAYQGLSAVLVLDESTVGKVAPFTGVIFPGDVPPLP